MANKVRFLDSTPLAAFGNTNPDAFTDLLKTASLQGDDLIFTKGNTDTFTITLPLGQGGIFHTSSLGSDIFATTSSLTISGSSLQFSPLPSGINPTSSQDGSKYAVVVSESLWHYNANVGVPTSNPWQTGLEGSYFNRFDHNTDISEILRFMAGILSASAPDASPNTNIWTGVNTSYFAGQSTTNKNSLFNGILGSNYENARLSQHWTSSNFIDFNITSSYKEAINYFTSKGFIISSDRGSFGNDTGTNPFHGSYASRIPSNNILRSNNYSTLDFRVSATATNTSAIKSSNGYFGLGALNNGNAVPYSVKILASQSYSDNYSNSSPSATSNNYFTASSITYTISDFGNSNGLFLAEIDTGKPSIPNGYQDGIFTNVDGPLSGRYYTNKATDSNIISSSGYYQMQDIRVGILTGSGAETMSDFEYKNGSNSTLLFYMPNPYNNSFTSTGRLVDITTSTPPTVTVSNNLKRTAFTATSRSLSGAPYLSTTIYNFEITSEVSKSFDPAYAYSTQPLVNDNPSENWSSIGNVNLTDSVVTMNVDGVYSIGSNTGVLSSDKSVQRSRGTIPHIDDIAFLSSSLTFTLTTSNNMSQTWNTSLNYSLPFRTRGKNWRNTSISVTETTQNFYDATLFGQPASSGSLATYRQDQGYDAGSLTGTSEQFSGEDFRIKINNKLLSGSYTNGDKFTTDTAEYYNLGALDLQVKPGYLVRPGGTYKYWLTDPDSTKTYKYYARAFQIVSSGGTFTKTELTINLGKTLTNWNSTDDGVSVAIMFESAQTGIDTGGGTTARPIIYDPSDTVNLDISLNQSTDNFLNPFTDNIDIRGNRDGSKSGNTYTIPLQNTLNQVLNTTYRNYIVIVRFKGDSSSQVVTNINVGY